MFSAWPAAADSKDLSWQQPARTVTIFDNSPAQLEQDRRVAEREGLEICLVEGDMADLSVFADACFDLIFHPVSNLFVPNVLPVWREAARFCGAAARCYPVFQTRSSIYSITMRSTVNPHC